MLPIVFGRYIGNKLILQSISALLRLSVVMLVPTTLVLEKQDTNLLSRKLLMPCAGYA
jgi:hypothetical protein